MLSDPISVTLDGSAQDLARTSFGPGTSQFSNATGGYLASVRQTKSKNRLRHEFRVSENKISPDPFVPSQNVQLGASVYLVVDQPAAGYTTAELYNLFTGLAGYLEASSGAAFSQIVLGEY